MQNYLNECNKQRCNILFTRNFRNGGREEDADNTFTREGMMENVVVVPARVLHEMILSSKIQKYVFSLLTQPLSLLVG